MRVDDDSDPAAARRRLEEELLLDTYLRRQHELEEAGVLPVPRDAVAVRRERLVLAGALELGFLVACFSIFAVLVIVNLLFHLEP